jgi:membrane protease YdiL (CAAX protease family)
MDPVDEDIFRVGSSTPADSATDSVTLLEGVSPKLVGFRSVPWTAKDLAVGLAVVALCRSLAFIPAGSTSTIPVWVVVAASCLFQGFLVAYPFWRARKHGVEVRWPGPMRLLTGFAISLPVVFGLLLLLVTAGFLLSRIAPNSSAMPPVFREATSHEQVAFVTAILILAVTIGPICEEVFFRGFLQNALRNRWPMAVATVVQSLIFAVMHTFGALHAAVAFFLGLFLTLVYEWRKSLVVPVFVHAGNNMFAAIVSVIMMIASANSPVLGVYGNDHPDGCQVDSVVPESAAAKANIAEGDVITDINGERILGRAQMSETIRRYRVGDLVNVGLNRNGEHLEIAVTLQKKP